MKPHQETVLCEPCGVYHLDHAAELRAVVEAARGVVNCMEIDEPAPWDRVDEHVNGGGCLVDLRDAVQALDGVTSESGLERRALSGERLRSSPDSGATGGSG